MTSSSLVSTHLKYHHGVGAAKKYGGGNLKTIRP